MSGKILTLRVSDEILGKLEKISRELEQNKSQVIKYLIERYSNGEDKSEIPVIEKYIYKKIYDESWGWEDIWKFGKRKDGRLVKIGPFIKEDIYDLIEQLPNVLNLEEMRNSSKLLRVGLEKMEEREKKRLMFLEKRRMPADSTSNSGKTKHGRVEEK